MRLLSQMQVKYGIPPTTPVYELYGVPVSPTPLNFINQLLLFITTPIFIVASFVIGIVIYLFTKKKLFLFIPLILGLIYLIKKFI